MQPCALGAKSRAQPRIVGGHLSTALGRAASRDWEVVDFAGFQLNAVTRTLTRNGLPVAIGDRALEILILLLERHGETVSKREMLDTVWKGMVVEESNLRVNVASLRRALGDVESGSRLIASVQGRGYSFVGAIEKIRSMSSGARPDFTGRTPWPQPGRIIGRDELVAQVVVDLPASGLLTLTGAGGIGKTAVAMTVVNRLQSAYRDGVFFVDLSPLPDGAMLATHLASQMRISTADADALANVVAHLQGKQLLMLLDNCEHVIEAASVVAEAVRAGARTVHILATSREPLRATGEKVLQVDPLAVPDRTARLTCAAALRFPSVELLNERVVARDARFAITDENSDLIAELCARLDGLPLAIELAATQIPVIGLRAVLDRLDDRMTVLTRGRRSALPRQQTLAAAIDWSYDSLSLTEKTVFRRLAVFSSHFDQSQAKTIALCDAGESLDVMDVVGRLVEKSLIVVDLRGSEVRYRMLESIRLYGFQKLLEMQEAGEVRRRHASFCLGRFMNAHDAWTDTANAKWIRDRGGEVADLRAALNWAYSPDGDARIALQLTATTAPFLFKLLLVSELKGYLERAIALASSVPDADRRVLMQLHVALGHCVFHTSGPVPAVTDSLTRGLRLADELADAEAQQQTLWALFGNHSTGGDYAAMQGCVERLRLMAEQLPNTPVVGLYHRVAALSLHLLGRHEAGLKHALQALRNPARPQSDDRIFVYDHTVATNSHYARILWMCGRADQAMSVIRSTLERVRTLDQPFALGYFLAFGAFPVAMWSGNLAEARQHVARLREIAAGTAFNVWQMAGRLYDSVIRFVESPPSERAAIAAQVDSDGALTKFQRESLATYSPMLVSLLVPDSSGPRQETWCGAEIMRARGALLRSSGSRDALAEAEALFIAAEDLARRQDALAWRLRAGTSLACLWRDSGQAARARAYLSGIVESFSEGFGTHDLIEAKALLQQLS